MPPDLQISADPSRLDYDWIFRTLNSSYWGAHYSRASILRAIGNSLCFGAYIGSNQQIGFARVVTDRAICSIMNDVVVDEAWRGQGVGTKMLEQVFAHPAVAPTICMLQTRSAHTLYQRFGFVSIGQMLKRDPR